jgi:pimeloyl-ACP methyl ester carboxylesterase
VTDTINLRRRLFGAAGMTLAVSQFGVMPPALARSIAKAGAPSAFKTVRQIQAGVLNVGYVDVGPADGPVAILLHGWPYDIHSFAEVAPLLAAAGFRVIVPHLRGHGSTTFLSAATPRNAQQAVVALDIVALMDALRIPKAVIAGYDWGARTANIMAALWPERVSAMVAVNGYLINNRARNQAPLAPKLEHGWWYQFYFATERGKAGYEANTREFARLLWKSNSPMWDFDNATFERSAASFDNPDYTRIVIHNYRWRLGLVEGELQYDELERRLALGPVIKVPSITLDGDADGVAPATDGTAYAAKFSGERRHRIVKGAGHNLPQEAPHAFARAVIDAASL